MKHMYPIINLLPKKDTNVRYRHPWIFSGAIKKVPSEAKHGDLVHLANASGEIIGNGTYSATSSIAVRVFAFSEVQIDRAWLIETIKRAEELRQDLGFGPKTETTGYRVCFGEVDSLPGIIIDRYEDVIVFQLSTAGADNLRDILIEAIKKVFKPSAIVERSDLSIRKQEKLELITKLHFGKIKEPVEFLENGLKFRADVLEGQKTGFFLDQKELRKQVQQFAKGSVLNLFAYTGATAIAALKGNATEALNIDSSQKALDQCLINAKLNKIKPDKMKIDRAEIFEYLENAPDQQFDTIILDPPALIKSQRDAEEGKKAYHFLNRAALRLLKPGGVFVTSSCSQFMSEDDFLFMLRQASVQAKKPLQILSIAHQAPDHPRSLYFPEASYLKSVIAKAQS